MHSGNAAPMPPARKAATFSFCQASRSVRITTAILVSNCIDGSKRRDFESTKDPKPVILEQDFGVDAIATPVASRLGVAGPGPDHAFLAAVFVAFAGCFVERTRNVRLHRIAVGAAGIGHVDGKRGTSALHRDRFAVAAALLQRGSACGVFGRIVIGLSISAAFADREGAGGTAFCHET